ncbi:hypothetical protein [Chryseolinea lacunae]|uniref:Uncharacterized protein n=1 Tax=Chryseolinea lacunae TaxID=2801331 RepID=A0ABS1L202_9BACT|nr:hypothetical protein [Chryseolinea lacunae]MBL0745720.1 hypothetical protein [Chryseolinea lacunae]
MNGHRKRWNFCIEHYNEEVLEFYSQHFGEEHRKCLFIGGAGFDPRSNIIVKQLFSIMSKRLHAIYIREERPDPDHELIKRAATNLKDAVELGCSFDVLEIKIFADDNAVVGGMNISNALKKIDFSVYTDIVVDISAISVGVSFPAVSYVYEVAKNSERPINVHLTVASDDELDSLISSTPIDRVTDIRGFSIPNLMGEKEKAKLWLPLISSAKKSVLKRIHAAEVPHDTCPIFPFPSDDPKKGDNLAINFVEELESEWEVDPRNFVYADEKRPLDIYRTIMRIDEERRPVFETFGGSMLILSPLGNKMPAIGMLMAALERRFPVVYVEALEYHVDWTKVDALSMESVQTAHVWLYGEAYHGDIKNFETNEEKDKI